MIRCIFAFLMLFSLTLSLGCTGNAEVKPDESQTPQVDEAEIQRKIQEGMKKGGMSDRYQGKAPGTPAEGEKPSGEQ